MLNRRELIAAILGWEVALTAGCSPPALPPAGHLERTNFRIGHKLRDGFRPRPPEQLVEQTGTLIVGGGLAGLSAAWRLLEAGVDDFVLLELEDSPGGTARGGRSGTFAYPWAAHYVPVPMASNAGLLRLLEELDVVEGYLADGSPVIAEQFLCRDPQERLFHDGRWQEGIYPLQGASEEERRELDEFRAEIDRWVAARDDQGRRMFAIPMAHGSDSAAVQQLDQISMAAWMDRHGWRSPRLRWYVDYACRDDYGLTIDQVSGWAGIFYFASRIRSVGDQPQSVITWPEGNARIANHLADRAGRRVRCGMAVSEISGAADGDQVSVVAVDVGSERPVGFRAGHVIFAAPQFLAPHLIRDTARAANSGLQTSPTFTYGSWLVANVHLSGRPEQNGFPMCWDNVIYGSKSLGYVTSTHQAGIDHGPTVLTWYYPFADSNPRVTRDQMLRFGWSDWADLVMTDLRTAHRDIDSLVTRVDIMCWGHAMVQPRVGSIWNPNRVNAAKPLGRIHFAGTDLSGVPLIEEAFYHGVRAAEEVLAARSLSFPSFVSRT